MSEKEKKKNEKGTKENSKKKVQMKLTDMAAEGGSSDKIPPKLLQYVSQEIWNMWSPIRRESFTQIIKNPNSFFYRNRPPGDPQKVGPFSPQEEQQFMERLKYFREELGIEDGYWGLFSVPILGRLGYQCSNFYRLLIKDGKIRDDNYNIIDGKLAFVRGKQRPKPPESIIKKLEQEAFDFINKCIETENGEAPKMEKPVRVAPPSRPKSREHVDKPILDFSSNVSSSGGRARISSDHRNGLNEEEFYASGGGKNGGRRKSRSLADEEEDRSPLYGALDPLTHTPMKIPLMDESGFVMDLQSWKQVFREGVKPPREIVAEHETDLIKITSKNFNQYRLMITNIPC